MEIMLDTFCDTERDALCADVPSHRTLAVLMCLNRHRRELGKPCAALVPRHPFVNFACGIMARMALVVVLFLGARRLIAKNCFRKATDSGGKILVALPLGQQDANSVQKKEDSVQVL